MDVTLAPTLPVHNRRARRARAVVPAPPTTASALERTLPLRASVGVRVSAPNWLWILGGAVIGGLVLGPIGALAGAAVGALLVR